MRPRGIAALLVGAALASCRRTRAPDPIDRTPEPPRPVVSPPPAPTPPAPILVLGGFTSCARIVSGADAGTVRCWGDDADPAVVGPTTVTPAVDVTSYAVGRGHMCILTHAGTVRCWGDNMFGQLGRPIIAGTSSLGPGEVPGLSSVRAVFAYEDATCALDAGGALSCFGALFDDRRSEIPRPIDLARPSAVSLSADGGCALVEGQPYCWGKNYDGHVVAGGPPIVLRPVAIPIHDVAEIATSSSETCVRLSGGEVRCWTGDEALHRVAFVDHAIQLAAGTQHMCALEAEGAVKCWGWNELGQLGDGTTVNKPYVVLSGIEGKPVEIASQKAHTCVRTEERAGYCWGSNVAHESSPGFDDPATPTKVTW